MAQLSPMNTVLHTQRTQPDGGMLLVNPRTALIGGVEIWHLALHVELPGVPGEGVRVAEWSKAPDSSSGPCTWAWVQIPLLTVLVGFDEAEANASLDCGCFNASKHIDCVLCDESLIYVGMDSKACPDRAV